MVRGYKVIDLIGKGAYGSVYEVTKGNKKYALKELAINQKNSKILE